MWKDFFYFSRGQRTGIIILIGLILCTVALNVLLPLFYSKKAPNGTDFLNEAHDFQRAMVSRDSLRQIAWSEKYKKEYNQSTFIKKTLTHIRFLSSTRIKPIPLHSQISASKIILLQTSLNSEGKEEFSKQRKVLLKFMD